MIAMELAVLILVGVAGTGVVLTRNPEKQVMTVSFMGIVLAIMFTVFQAPDVSLSQIVIGAVGLPLMVMLALARLKRDAADMKSKQPKNGENPS